MAKLVKIVSGTTTYYVNADNVKYVVGYAGEKLDCTIVFDKENAIYIDAPIDRVVSLLETK